MGRYPEADTPQPPKIEAWPEIPRSSANTGNCVIRALSHLRPPTSVWTSSRPLHHTLTHKCVQYKSEEGMYLFFSNIAGLFANLFCMHQISPRLRKLHRTHPHTGTICVRYNGTPAYLVVVSILQPAVYCSSYRLICTRPTGPHREPTYQPTPM